MSEATRLLVGLKIIRALLELPTSLSAAALKTYRGRVQNLGDRCYFNSGWSARSDAPLKGSAASEAIFPEIYEITASLQKHAKKARRRGRPAKDSISYGDLLVLAAFNVERGKMPLQKCIEHIFDLGELNRNVQISSHLRRIERILDRFQAENEPT
jgi:hypothetical protein